MIENKKTQKENIHYKKKQKMVTNPVTYNTKGTELKKKLINHITKEGEKHKSEKAVTKSFKATLKSQKKNHGKVVKLTVINTIPTFKVIKLTDKKRRKKSIREIPTLVSNYKSRVSLGLKYLIKSTTASTQTVFSKKFKNELLSGAISENNAAATKNTFQAKAVVEKKYFRFYRW